MQSLWWYVDNLITYSTYHPLPFSSADPAFHTIFATEWWYFTCSQFEFPNLESYPRSFTFGLIPSFCSFQTSIFMLPNLWFFELYCSFRLLIDYICYLYLWLIVRVWICFRSIWPFVSHSRFWLLRYPLRLLSWKHWFLDFWQVQYPYIDFWARWFVTGYFRCVASRSWGRWWCHWLLL